MSDDDDKYNPLRGGIQVQVESSSRESGTLGCFARTNRQGEPARIVLLSVAHLLYAGRSTNVLGPITQSGSRACHPDACSKCSRCCSDDIGDSLRGEFTVDVDAAIATVYAGTRFLREVEGLGVIRSTHVITEAEAHDRTRRFRVRKRGIATRLTEGTVRALDFAVRSRSGDDSFDRVARNQILVQPRTLVQVPIDAIQANGVIQAPGAQFQTNGVTTNHFVEVSGPTRNRGLFKVHEVRSETEIVLQHPRAPDFAAALTAEQQRPFTPVVNFVFDPGRNGVEAPGLAANNPGLLPFDMAEITGAPTNNGTFQIQPLQAVAILLDVMAVYEQLTQEAAAGAQVRGLIFIRVRDELFVNDHDSGAVLLSDNQEVVGLIAGRVAQDNRPDLRGYAFGAPIQAVMNQLGIDILTAVNANDVQIVAASEGEPRPGGPVAVGLRPEDRAVLLRAQEELLETETAKKYVELARLHHGEVQTLINTNKRVAVVWQRNGGPLLFQVALNAVQHPDARIPGDINGRPLAFCMSNILEALDKYGSAPLKSDIAQFGHAWTLLPGKSFNDVKNELRKPLYDRPQ